MMRETRVLSRQGLPTVRRVAATVVAVTWATSPFPQATVLAADGPIRQSLQRGVADPGDSESADRSPREISPEVFVTRQTLNQVLYRDRQQRRTFERAVGQLRERNVTETLKLLQHLLDQPEDVFAWFDGDRQPSSVRRKVLRVFRKLDPSTLRTYEDLYGPEARRLLKTGRFAGSPVRDREVARRFFHTQAGFQAVDRLAARWFDRGDYARAARAWSILIAEPVHRRRVSNLLLVRAALAHHLCGHSAESEALLRRIGDVKLRIAGRRVSPRPWVLNRTPRPGIAGRSPEGRSRVTTPYLKPLWRVSFSSGANADIGELLNQWEAQQANLFEPSAVVRSAIVVRGQVVVRDFSGIRAWELKTGAPLWVYRCRTSLAKTVGHIKERYGHVSARSSGGARLNLQQQYAGNGTLGLLSSDGRRVYAVDAVTMTPQPTPSARGKAGSRSAVVNRPTATNRLIALSIHGASGRQRPVWWIGGGPDEREPSRPLAGHFFLGPPLPADGRLFGVTESGRQLNLVALDPQTGSLLWRQGIGFVERSIDRDLQRSGLPCVPLFAEGVIVCPTQLGVLVGVDAVTGTLLWAYRYGEDGDRRRAGSWSRLGAVSYGYTGFAVRPHIVGNRVLVLPRHSARVHCINLFTGRPIWTRPRGDAEYIGTVARGVVLMVGRRSCRGLSLQTGAERWKIVSAMPSGRGIAAGNRYLLPLATGRIAVLNPLTGLDVGLNVRADGRSFTTDAAPTGSAGGRSSSTRNAEAAGPWRPGNLVAGRGIIISTGPRGLTVFPQAGPLLTRVRHRLTRWPNSTADRLQAAELELVLGRLDASKTLLRQVLKSAPTGDSFRRAEQLMRTVLVYELDHGLGSEAARLAQLDRLSHTPRERGRYLMRRVQSELRQGRLNGVLSAARELSALQLRDPLPFDGDDEHLVSPASWVRSMVGRARTRCVRSPVVLTGIRLSQDSPRTPASDRIESLERYLDLYARWPRAETVRNRLAQRFIDTGHFQRAELLLLRNRKSRNRHTAAAAVQKLALLWDRLGLSYEAAGLLTDLRTNYPQSLRAGQGQRGGFLSRFSENGSTLRVYRWMSEPRRLVASVSISQKLWSGAAVELKQPYAQYRRKLVTPAESTFDLLDKGDKDVGRLAVVDRHSGLVRHEIKVPTVYWYPVIVSGARVGHFLPLGAKSGMYGLSLLDATRTRPMWRAAPRQRRHVVEPLRVGPAGPTFCLFQSRRHLVAVNPATGQILWQRSGLDPYGGLLSDPRTGLFGDEKAVVFFGSDRRTYTAYRTATGEKLSHSRLDAEILQPRRAFGRRLCYVYRPPGDGTPRLRIWDPLGNRVVFDRPAFETLSGNTMFRKLDGGAIPSGGNNGEIVAVLADKTLCAIRVADASIRWSIPLDDSDLAGLNNMRVCRDRDHYYVNLQRAVSADHSIQYSYTVSNTFLQVMSVRTDLHVVDARTGRRLWKRRFPDCSLVRTPYLRLPFLIVLSRLRDRRNTSLQSLRIELIDNRSGRTLGSRDNLFPDGILRLDYQPHRSRLELYGRRTRIGIDFGHHRSIASAVCHP